MDTDYGMDNMEGENDLEIFYASSDSDIEYSEHKSDSNGDVNDIRFAYRPSTWSKTHSSYDPIPIPFSGQSPGLTREYNEIPSYVQFFKKIWTFNMLRDICVETNRYAGSLDENGVPRGRIGWYLVIVKELKVFMATNLYVGMKKLPNVKAYWTNSKEIFYCHVITGLFTRESFMALTQCLYITNPSTYIEDNTSPHFDKMHQTRWLINAIRSACKRKWNLGQYVTVAKSMVKYKGTYCPVRQYMPKKQIKWGLKVWCLADSKSRFIVDFDVYCGKSQVTLERGVSVREEQTLAHRVVIGLTTGL
jgi:hypothetical protein